MSLDPQPPVRFEQPCEVMCDLDGASFREVRRLVRDMLAGRDDLTADDAVLVSDELVSNAHRHGASPRYCRIALLESGQRLRIEVDDGSPWPPRKRTPDHTGGRGLVLVDQLTDRWGVQQHRNSKTVWAEFVLNRPAGSGKAPHLTLSPGDPDPPLPG